MSINIEYDQMKRITRLLPDVSYRAIGVSLLFFVFLFTGRVAAQAAGPGNTPDGNGGDALNIVAAIVNAFFNLFADAASWIIGGLVSILGLLFSAGTAEFLFFAAPSEVPGLAAVWDKFAVLYFALLPISGGMFFLTMQLFPENQEADIYRFFERTLAATVALIVTSPVLANFTSPYLPGDGIDMFSAAVYLVNEIGLYIFPDSYSLQFLADNLNGMMGAMTGVVGLGSVVGIVIAIAFFGTAMVLSVAMTVAFFYLVLAMRMVLVYTAYAMMPLLLVLWINDIGPLKYGKTVASLVWKITAVLLLFGIVISGVLATTSAIADPGSVNTVGFSDETYANDTQNFVSENGTVENSTLAGGPGRGAGAAGPGGFELLFLRLFAWISGIVLSVAITTSALGMLISTHGSGGTARRIRQGRSPDAGGARSLSGGGFGGGGGGSGGAPGGGGTAATVDTNQEGTAFVGSEDANMAIDEDGVNAFESSAPENVAAEDELEAVPLKDKAKHVGSKAVDKASVADDKLMGGRGKGMKDAAAEKAEAAKDVSAEDVGDAVEGAGKAVGGSAYSKVDPRVEKMSERAGSAAEKATGVASDVASRGKEFGQFVGSGLKRGGKAYYSVLKQPTVGGSIGEAQRIARESPIGHPNKGSGAAPEESEPLGSEKSGEDYLSGQTEMGDYGSGTDPSSGSPSESQGGERSRSGAAADASSGGESSEWSESREKTQSPVDSHRFESGWSDVYEQREATKNVDGLGSDGYTTVRQRLNPNR